ncbi:MAG: dimethylargininase [Oceanospirillaceae bacterium]|jgi:dimethylargininase
MFSKAIVKKPCRAVVSGITSADLGIPDYDNALVQHAKYVQALKDCGLEVTELNADEAFPDSTFVEDAALMTPHCAIITNPGAASRKGEVTEMHAVVSTFYDKVERIQAPGTVEAGDIMMVGEHYYIGLSERTNEVGAQQMIHILEKHGMSGSIVTMSEVLHLKTGLGYLEDNKLLACGEFLTKAEFSKYQILEVDASEAYAANSVWINDKVLTPKGFPKTKALIENAGFEVVEVDVSEFQKIDGGLSCLSLRF